MNAKWQKTALGENIKTQKGYAFKSRWYSDIGQPIVKVSDFTADSIDTNNLVRIPYDIAKKFSKYELTTGDVVIQTVGSWPSNPQSVVGKAIRIPSKAKASLLNQNAVKLIPNQNIDNRYLFYLLRSNRFKEYIVGTAQGAASQASITLDAIRAFNFSLPPLPIQHRISSILSAYDDLIENNTRRIRILEEMAQSLYREWFVHFRFPGHEKIKLVSSPLGKIPGGWRERYHHCVDFKEGPGLRKWQYRDEGIPFLNIRTLINNDIDMSKVQFIDKEEVAQKYAHFLLEPFDHVVSSSGTIGRLVTIQRFHLPLMLNTSIIRMRPRTEAIGKWQLKHFLQSEYFQSQIKAHAIGSAQINFGPSHLNQMWIIKPDIRTGRHYEMIVSPIELQICNIVRKNVDLRRTRDLLLRKLISGEIRVDA